MPFASFVSNTSTMFQMIGRPLPSTVLILWRQLFFYVPAFGWMLMWFWQNGYSRKKYLLLSGIGFFFLFFGMVAEVYLNPMILQHILRKL